MFPVGNGPAVPAEKEGDAQLGPKGIGAVRVGRVIVILRRGVERHFLGKIDAIARAGVAVVMAVGRDVVVDVLADTALQIKFPEIEGIRKDAPAQVEAGKIQSRIVGEIKIFKTDAKGNKPDGPEIRESHAAHRTGAGSDLILFDGKVNILAEAV